MSRGGAHRRQTLPLILPVILQLLPCWLEVDGQGQSQTFTCFACDNRNRTVLPRVTCELGKHPSTSTPITCGAGALGCAVLYEFDGFPLITPPPPKWTWRGCWYNGQRRCLNQTGSGSARSGGTEDAVAVISAIANTLSFGGDQGRAHCDARQLTLEGERVHWPYRRKLFQTFEEYDQFVKCRMAIQEGRGEEGEEDLMNELEFYELVYRKDNFEEATFGAYHCNWKDCNRESYQVEFKNEKESPFPERKPTTTTTPTTTKTTPTTTPRRRHPRTPPSHNPDWTWRTDLDDEDCDCAGCGDSSAASPPPAWLTPSKSFLFLTTMMMAMAVSSLHRL